METSWKKVDTSKFSVLIKDLCKAIEHNLKQDVERVQKLVEMSKIMKDQNDLAETGPSNTDTKGN
jgi:hypothetical protein